LEQHKTHAPADTRRDQLDRLIGAGVAAAGMLVGSRPADRAVWLELLADRLDGVADDLVPLAMRETRPRSSRRRYLTFLPTRTR
jgi:NADP-dependent aldehyde dehydrogenase